LIDCWIVNIQRQICNTYAEREQVQQCLKIYIDIMVGWGQPDMGLQEGQIGTTQNDISPKFWWGRSFIHLYQLRFSYSFCL